MENLIVKNESPEEISFQKAVAHAEGLFEDGTASQAVKTVWNELSSEFYPILGTTRQPIETSFPKIEMAIRKLSSYSLSSEERKEALKLLRENITD